MLHAWKRRENVKDFRYRCHDSTFTSIRFQIITASSTKMTVFRDIYWCLLHLTSWWGGYPSLRSDIRNPSYQDSQVTLITLITEAVKYF
jgi:hypothetical protein